MTDMDRLVAIEGGGDWADASVDYLIVPDGVDIEEEKVKRRKWYRDVYCPAYRVFREHCHDQTYRPEYSSLAEWLIRHCGARLAEVGVDLEVAYDGP